eukprot:GGOE01013215.1.p1 GENE.GGOE01013215.1~~GGOE01013215.1.p1  ORF type:complete len:601 (-),score=166.83 GGOE01013215.1:1009-2811(-)
MAQMPMVDSIFCGRVCTKTRCICNSSSCCLNDAQLTTIDSYPDFVNYHGIVQLPGLACKANQLATYHLDTFTTQCTDCPAGTYAYNENQISECRICPATMYSLAGSMNCTACPAGTYGNQPRQQQCISCPAGSIAPDVASMHCQPCSSGLSSNDGTRCETASLLWVAGVCGGVGGGLLVVGLLLLWWAQTYGKRNNRAAPKNASQPFCIVFTDIQSSTSLWATIPDVMAGALDAHHALIRKLIAKHRCYEVKTIGDSFMCATRSPATAVQFAVALQREFFAYRWGTDAIDTEYLRAQEGGPGWGGEHKGWNGLRVRVGIHYGMGDIELDPVSRGYDYYGTVVNTAARIEAVTHGGQVIVSQDLMKALPAPLDPSVGLAILLGAVPLRGVVEPPALVEVKPTSLQGRKFPPLRVDADKVPLAEPLPWDSAAFVSSPNHRDRELHGSPSHRELQGYSGSRRLSTGSSHNSNGSMATHTLEELARSHTMVQNGLLSPELLSHHLLALYHIVEDLLKPLAPQQHTTVAKALATGWGVPPPKGKLDFGNTAVRLVHRMSETTRVLCHFQPPPPPTAHSLVPAPCPLPTTQSLQGISYSTVSMLSH